MQATLCVCQALFMMAQYPKIGWEPIYMPLCEAANYGLGWAAIHKFNAASRAGRPRDFEEQDKADPRCPWRIQKQTVFNLKAVMVCDCHCLPVRGAHT